MDDGRGHVVSEMRIVVSLAAARFFQDCVRALNPYCFMEKQQIIQQQYFDLSLYLNSTNMVKNRPKEMYFYIERINDKIYFLQLLLIGRKFLWLMKRATNIGGHRQ